MKKTKTKRRGGRQPGTWSLVKPEQIREYRASNKISRATLATMLGVSSTTIVNWETGKAVATTRLQSRIQSVLGRAPMVSLVSVPSAVGNGNGAAALEAVGQIVAAYLQGAKVEAEELPGLVQRVRAALG